MLFSDPFVYIISISAELLNFTVNFLGELYK